MEHADVLMAIADPTRLKILELLGHRGYCVGVLAGILGISAPAVSQHMKVLQNAGLVNGVRRGYHTHYSVDRAMLMTVAKELGDIAALEPAPCMRDHEPCGNGGKADCVRCCRRTGQEKDE